MSKIKVVLYGKEGEVKTELSPETEASQVYIASESGNPSTVEEEINVLRQKTDTSDKLPQGTTNLYMTSAERTKLSGISAGAEKNQNAFNKITVDGTAVTASSPTSYMTINTGDGIRATVSGTTVTIDENYIDSCIVSSLDDVPANLRNGDPEDYYSLRKNNDYNS